MKKRIALALFLILSVPAAFADTASICEPRQKTVAGDPAKAMIQALRFGNVAGNKVGADEDNYTLTLSLPKLSCAELHGTNDGIFLYNCDSPQVSNNPALAKLYFDTVMGLGIYGDGALGRTFAAIDDLSCVLTMKRWASPTYQCTATGVWTSDCR